MKVVTQSVRNSGALYAWTASVTGIYIDARGVTNPKDNPKISYDYVQGFQALAYNNNNKTVTVRSFATGGAQPPEKAVKSFRTNDSTVKNEKIELGPKRTNGPFLLVHGRHHNTSSQQPPPTNSVNDSSCKLSKGRRSRDLKRNFTISPPRPPTNIHTRPPDKYPYDTVTKIRPTNSTNSAQRPNPDDSLE